MLAAVGLAWFFESQATTTIIFLRHAEQAPAPASDPGLSPAGEARAAELARVLELTDVVDGVDVIYATQYRRTADTVRPLARARELEIMRYDAADTVTVLEEILRDHKGRIVVVAGHSNTVPALIAELGGSKHVVIGEGEYDNIFIVSIPWFGKTKTLRLKYGAPSTAGG